MNIVHHQEGDVHILEIEGTITIGEGDVQLRETIEQLIEKNQTKIILNLERVGYMDSSGVGELISCYKETKSKGGDLKLLNLSKKIKDLLQITQLLSVFEYYDDEAKAINSFQ